MTALPAPANKAARTLELVDEIRRGDEAALDEMVRLHAPLVRSICARFTGRGLDAEDLMQIGSIGLIKAARGFDPSLGFAFSTYAVPLVMGEMRRALRDEQPVHVARSIKENAVMLLQARERFQERHGREGTVEEIAARAGLRVDDAVLALGSVRAPRSLSEPVTEEGDTTLGDSLRDESAEIPGGITTDVRDAVGRLNERERTLVSLRYFKGYTQCQTAEWLGVSQVQVSRIEKKALEKLRGQLA